MSAFGPEQWRSLSPYLDKVLEISPNDRATWLEMLRQQNPSVATDLQILPDPAEGVPGARRRGIPAD